MEVKTQPSVGTGDAKKRSFCAHPSCLELVALFSSSSTDCFSSDSKPASVFSPTERTFSFPSYPSVVPFSLKYTVFSNLNNLYRRALQVYFQNTHLTIFASFLDMSVLFLSILCAHFYLQLFPSFLSALSYVKSIGEFWPGLLWKIGPVLFVSGTGVY